MRPTYKEQFDKITRAYIADELIRTDSCACFIGNMLNKTWKWSNERILGDDMPLNLFHAKDPFQLDPEYSFYTMQEIVDMENCFMTVRKCFNAEEDIFLAMESTLEMLKQIHISKGEVIDDAPVFEKRKLQTT